MSITPPATTESRDILRSLRSQPYKALFSRGGYDAASGLISREIIQILRDEVINDAKIAGNNI